PGDDRGLFAGGDAAGYRGSGAVVGVARLVGGDGAGAGGDGADRGAADGADGRGAAGEGYCQAGSGRGAYRGGAADVNGRGVEADRTDGLARLVDLQLDRGAGVVVLRGVGRYEADVQGLEAAVKHGARGRGVGEDARYGGCGVELGSGKGRAVGDRGRRRPGDDRGLFAGGDAAGYRGSGAVVGVARLVGGDGAGAGGDGADRGAADGADGRGAAGEGYCQAGSGRGAYRGGAADVNGRGVEADRTDGLARLVDLQLDRGAGVVVLRGVGRYEADVQGLEAAVKHGARGRGVVEDARYGGCGVELGSGKGRAVGDRGRRRPGDDRGLFAG